MIMLVILGISNSRDIVNHNISTYFSEYKNCRDNVNENVSTCFSEYQTVQIMLMIMLVLASQNIKL
jgi:hypothetical protein